MIPVVSPNGVSAGFLKPADGLVDFATGPGADRGGINWNDTMYRVMGSKLVSIDSGGTVVEIGDVGDNGKDVSMDYSFDQLAVCSNENLYYWDGVTFTDVKNGVPEPDVGDAIDMIWIDGYFMLTDGEFIVTTDINDPNNISSFNYNSAEVDPDPLKGLLKVRNEAHAIGRFTIETFRNVGGSGFPFQRVTGGHIEKGAVGTHAFTEYQDQIVFVGGGRNEQISVHQGVNGRSSKIATREVDEILEAYTESQLEATVVEYRNDRSSDLIYIHLPDRTIVYNLTASQSLGNPVWFNLTSSTSGFSEYRAKHFVYVYNEWHFGDPTTSKVGVVDDTISSHFGDKVRWEFGTQMLYNEGNGATVDELELVALTGSVALSTDARITTNYSLDGQTYSLSRDRTIDAGSIGDRLKRLVWRRQGRMPSVRTQRFQGDSDTHISFLRLEAQLTPLYN